MNKPVRNFIAAGAVAAGLLSGGAVALAQTPSTSTSTEQSATTTPDQSRPAPPSAEERAAHEAERNADLATRLGLTVDQVSTAEEAARAAVDAQLGTPERPATPPSTPPTEAERAAMKAQMDARHDLFEQTFAEQLGVTTDQLRAAREAGLAAHLADEVASGKITQEQADARLQAIQNGEVGPGGPGGPGHGGPPPADAPASTDTTTAG